MKPTRNSFLASALFHGRQLLLPAAAFISFAGSAQAAATRTWIASPADANWATAANWGGTAPVATDSIVFATSSTTSLNNNLTAALSLAGITFNSGASAFTTTGNSITLGGDITDNATNAQALNTALVLSAARNVTVASGGSLALGGVTSGAFAVTKLGAGTLTLNGSAVNTYTGATAVKAGTLKLDFSNLAAFTNLVNSGSALQLGGGTLQVVGQAGVATSQTFNTLTTSAGNSVISAAPASGLILPTVTLGTYAANQGPGATVEFVGPATIDSVGNVAATATITTTTAGTGAFGNMGAFGLGKNGAYATVGLYDFASTNLAAAGGAGTSPYTVIGGSQVTGFYQSTGITTGSAAYDMPATGGTNTLGNATGSPAVRFNNNAAQTISFSATTANGIQGFLVTPKVGAFNTTISGGGIEFIRTTTGGNCYGVVWQNNTLGYLNFNSAINPGRQAGQANGLVQAGPGTVVYGGANDYELATYLNGGFSVVTANSGFGRVANGSAVNLNGGTAVGNATFTMDNAGASLRAFTLASNGGGLAATGANVMTIDGVISGAAGTGALTIGIPASSANGNVAGLLPGSGAGTANTTAVNATGTVVLTGANTYTGGTIVQTGTVKINGIYNLGGYGTYGGLTLNGGTTQYAATANGAGSLDLSSGSGITLSSGGGTIDTNGNDVTYASTIGNGGSGALTKAGAGTLTLGAANTYTGGTTISAGTLNVTNTSGSATGPGAVALNAGTLAGSGTIAGTVTMGGGTLAPGAAGTTLTLVDLTYNSGTLNPTLNGSGPTSSHVNVTNATFTAPPVLTFTGGTTVSNGQSFTVLTSTNAITGASFLSSIAPTTIGRITLAPQLSGNSIVVNATGAAASLVWAGGVSGLSGSITGDTTTWSNTQTVATAGNWNNSGARDYFYDGDTVTFNDAGTPNYTVNLTTNNAPGSLAVNSTGNYTFSGSGSVTGTTSLVKSGAGTLTLSTANTYTGGTTVSAGTLALGAANALPAGGSLTVQGSGTLDLGGFSLSESALSDGGAGTGSVTSSSPATLTVNNALATTSTYSGAINGSVTVSKSGLGTLVLSGTNGFTGGVTISSGIVQLGSAGALNATTPATVAFGASSTGTLQLNGHSVTVSGLTTDVTVGTPVVENANATAATLTINKNVDGTYAGVLRDGTGGGALSLAKYGTGILTLSGGLNTFTGTTEIHGGTVTLGNSLALQGSTLNYNAFGGTLSFGTLAAATLGGLSGGQDLALTNASSGNVSLTVGSNNGTSTYSGILSGGGSLSKNGTGTLALSGANTYTGQTVINKGTLSLTNALGTSGTPAGAITVQTGGTLNLNNATVYAPYLSNTNSGGNGVVNITGTSSLTLSGNLGVTNNGTNLGFVNFTGGSVSANSVTIGRSYANYDIGVLAGSAGEGLYINGGALTIAATLNLGSGSNSSALLRLDSGSVTVGGTTIINTSANIRASLIDVNGGTFTSNDSAGVGIQIGGTGTNFGELLVRGSGTLNAHTITMGIAGPTSGVELFDAIGGTTYLGSGGIVALGTVVPTINLGSATVATAPVIAASADWSSSLAMTLTNSSAAVTPTFQAAEAGGTAHNITLSGALGGAGGIAKTGAGTLTLAGANSYTGATTVNAGTLAITGTLAATAVTVDSAANLDAGNNTAGNVALGASVTVNSGGHLAFHLDATTATQVTRTLTGALALNGVIDVAAATAPTAGASYTLVTASGGITGAPAVGTLSGVAGTFSVSGGNNLVFTVASASGYGSWASGKGLTSGNNGALQDPNNNGITNLMEYVLNGDPLNGESPAAILPTLNTSGSNFVFTFHRLSSSASDTTQVFEYGSDLFTWAPPVPIIAGTTGTVTVAITANTPTTGMDEVVVTVPKGAYTKLFGRLQATQP